MRRLLHEDRSCSWVCSRTIDDAAPTPLMHVMATPQVGNPFRFDVLPDTGCEQTMISLDLVTANGMVVDTNLKKRLRAANGAPMKCSGSVVLRVAFQGAEIDVLALVTPSLRKEILLSWRALQQLGIIPKDFPNRIAKVKAVSATPQKQWPRGILQKISAYEHSEREAWRGKKMGKDKRDKDKASSNLEPLQPGDIVYVQDPITLRWDSTAKVINKRGQKFYNIEEDGWIYLKNRRFLRPCPNPPDDKKSGPTDAGKPTQTPVTIDRVVARLGCL